MNQPDQWTALEFFQIDNLIRGRVAFHILNLGVDFEQLYPMKTKPMERIHIRNREIKVGADLTPTQIVAVIETEKIALPEPIVIFCQDGVLSERVAALLYDKGYKNVYFARGGMEALAEF